MSAEPCPVCAASQAMPGRRGCHTSWGGRRFEDRCDECGHMLVAHSGGDMVCAICLAVAELHPVERES